MFFSRLFCFIKPVFVCFAQAFLNIERSRRSTLSRFWCKSTPPGQRKRHGAQAHHTLMRALTEKSPLSVEGQPEHPSSAMGSPWTLTPFVLPLDGSVPCNHRDQKASTQLPRHLPARASPRRTARSMAQTCWHSFHFCVTRICRIS